MSLPPLFSRSSSDKKEYEETKEFFDKGKGSIAHAQAECTIYKLEINKDHPNLMLYEGFQTSILKMDEVTQCKKYILYHKQIIYFQILNIHNV